MGRRVFVSESMNIAVGSVGGDACRWRGVKPIESEWWWLSWLYGCGCRRRRWGRLRWCRGRGLATAVALLAVKARVVGAVENGCDGIGRVCRCSSGTQGECI